MIATSVSHYPKVGNGPGRQRLRQAIAQLDKGAIDRAALDRVADEVTAEVIQEQERAGLDLVTDGQIRWQDPVTYIAGRLEGFELHGLLRWFETNTYYRQPVATGPITWKEPILVRDFLYAREHASSPVKAVLTGPYSIGTLSETRHHQSRRDFVLELAGALNQELKALAEEGPAWIQIDEPAMARNPSVRYPRDFELFGEAMYRLTEGVNQQSRLSLYIYHGDVADYPQVADLPFALIGLDLVQGAANWDLVGSWPDSKAIGLGAVDARNVRLEDPDEVARRIAAVAAREIHVSPSCGLEFLPRETAFQKLELVARAAHAVEART